MSLRRFLPLFMGGVLLGVFLYQSRFAGVGSIEWQSKLPVVLAIVALNGMPLFLKTYRWRFLLESRGVRLAGQPLFRTVSAGFFFGLATPGTGGELTRGLLLRLRRTESLATVAFEKVLDFGVLFALSVSSVAQIRFGRIGGLGILAGLMASLFAIASWLPQVSDRRPWEKPVVFLLGRRFRKAGLRAMRAFGSLGRNRTILGRSILVSGALWMVPLIQFILILEMIETRAGWELAAASFFGPYLIGVISLVPFGLGITDLGIAYTMVALSDSGIPGLGGMVVILFRLMVTLPLVLWGFGCFMWGKMGEPKVVPAQSRHPVL